MDEDDVRRMPVHEIGMALDSLSVDELEHRIEILKDEIVRLERAVSEKSASRDAADAVFKI